MVLLSNVARAWPCPLLVRGSITHVQETGGKKGRLSFKGISLGGSGAKAEVNEGYLVHLGVGKDVLRLDVVVDVSETVQMQVLEMDDVRLHVVQDRNEVLLLVRVQVPEDGSPLSLTVPVETPQVGCVIVPTIDGKLSLIENNQSMFQGESLSNH